ncbi:MAG: ankyrin repeat domain-containing protein [Verrucomicrobia bacterium]|nr:ankyrin repeat domain-containing protein [Verrucomicrobiota bacterium]MBU4289498.1 ankyrin repeat domain-containing protein [Verrucomicrobiota bacterium]MBU4429647.1 ankyrin repeat domain-containing protein [Verrucomicrobiota bacterium]MBU4496384.1 ankyrin repeat domain-containing protein [Verrucomicrobiota bacterium]MCG2678773.1 ankyrin repeat domain-containing protein [Kiritimatiellia bacterium]
MRLTEISSRQIPLIVVIFAAIIVFVAVYTRCVQMTDAEKAIKAGSLSKLTAVINKHPDLVNKPDQKNGYSPLHWAVLGNQTNMVNFLLSRGAAVNAADRYGMTPLHKAAAFGRRDIAELLATHGANQRAFGIKYGVIRVAPIHLAAESGFPDLVKLFLDQGVDINIRTQGTNQVTPLHMAAAKGRAEVVEILLKAGADVNARDVKNETPLHWAIIAGQQEVADMLKIYDGTE